MSVGTLPPFPGPTASSVLSIGVSSVKVTAKHLLDDHLWPEPLFYGSRTMKLLRLMWPWVWKGMFGTGLVYGIYLLYLQRKRRARGKNVERSYQLFGHGVRFGLDIGGTLCKVVYFEPEETFTHLQTSLKGRVSTFIRRSSSYGVTGRRDSELEVSLHPIRGTLHFLKFQTSMMPNFITIVKENELIPTTTHTSSPSTVASSTSSASSSSSSSSSTHSTVDTVPNDDGGASERRNNHSNSHHHHHNSTSLLIHPTQIGRSYSAAWRSEEEFRQKYINSLHSGSLNNHDAVVENATATSESTESSSSTTAAGSSDTHQHTDAEQTEHSTTQKDDTTATAHAVDNNHTHVAPDSTSSSSSSSTSSSDFVRPQLSVNLNPPATVPTSTRKLPANNNTNVSTPTKHSSRAITPPQHGECSASCPSSPLALAGGAYSHTNGGEEDTNRNGPTDQFDLNNSKHGVVTNSNNTSSSASSVTSSSSSASSSSSSSSSTAALGSSSSSTFPSFLSVVNSKRRLDPSPRSILPPSVCATGGGAFKFEALFREELGIELQKEDELRALVKGIDFMIHSCPNECYYLSSFRFRDKIQQSSYPSSSISYPYLVVNIGSGVSILKVTGPSSFERVGGTSLGGGTFYGLCRALTGCTSFEEALRLAELGRGGTADLLVGDIYGGDYTELGLGAHTVAASFGKLVRGDALKDVRKEDLAKAALIMITNNIGTDTHTHSHTHITNEKG